MGEVEAHRSSTTLTTAHIRKTRQAGLSYLYEKEKAKCLYTVVVRRQWQAVWIACRLWNTLSFTLDLYIYIRATLNLHTSQNPHPRSFGHLNNKSRASA